MDVPKLVWSEEIPVGPPQKRAEDDEQDPQNQKSKQKRCDFPTPLFDREVTVSLGIRVDVGDSHQADDDQAGKHNAREPRIEVDEHFLQSKEIPGRLRRIWRARRLCRLY